MTDKNTKRERLIEKRAHALAIMYLTRRDDLTIGEVQEDIGLDLLVHFLPAGKDGVRQFGVALRGAWAPVSREEADRVLRPSIQRLRRYGPFPFPVCLFFFTMEENQSWYTWVAEPVVAPDGTFRLRLHDSASCKPLDKAAVNEIVGQVDRWYDAFFGTLVTG
jgi:hypothetical protein